MFDPERDLDDDEMTEAESAELKARMLARGHLNSDGTLDNEAILADSVPFAEFEAWYAEQQRLAAQEKAR